LAWGSAPTPGKKIFEKIPLHSKNICQAKSSAFGRKGFQFHAKKRVFRHAKLMRDLGASPKEIPTGMQGQGQRPYHIPLPKNEKGGTER